MTVESIKDYGAVENPNDSDSSAAAANHQALLDAASAAGANGTVYIPEGTYYCGNSDYGNLTLFGSREPSGVSFTGDGPTKSVVGPSQYRGDNNYWLFNYDDGADHGSTVSFDNLRIDGQGRNLSLQPDYGRSGRLINADGNSGTTLELQNVHLYDAYTAAVKNAGSFVLDIDRCTFERIGVSSSEDAGVAGHALADGAGASSDPDGLVTNSEFYRLARTVIDYADGGGLGTVRFENCWCKGVNLAFVKSGADARVELQNVYSEHRTQWTQDLNRGDGRQELNGRHFVQNLTNTGGTFEVDVQDVQVVNTNRHGVFNYSQDASASNVLLSGDRVAFDGMSRGTESGYNSAFDDDGSQGGALEFDVTEMSVHNTGGGDDQVFNTPNGAGTISTLHRGNNSGLGTSNSVSIDTDDTGGSPLSPTVPSQSDVGVNSDTGSSPTGSWQTPTDGATTSETVTVQVTASDAEDGDDALAVEYRVDGDTWSTASYNSTTGYYEDGWDSRTVTDGSHRLEARATDSDGDSSTAAVDVTVDNETTLSDGWTPQWSSDQTDWSVVSGSTFEGEYALVFENDAGDRTRYALSSDDVGQPADVETLDKFRVQDIRDEQSGAAHARVYLRAGATSAGENGYLLDVDHTEGLDQPNAFRIGKYTDGYFQQLTRFGTPTEGTFFYRRFRAEGTTLKAKVWPAAESEPTGWDVELTDTDNAEGWVGLGSFDPQRVETDVFSVATGGATASFVNLDSSPTVSWVTPSDAETVSDSVTLQVDGSDAEDATGSLAAEYRVDGGSWSTASYSSTTGYYEAVWDTTTVADGSHTLDARVTDSAGNASTAAVSVTADNTAAPTVDGLSLSEVETSDSDAEFDADWQVGDGDGDLGTVELALVQESDGTTEDSATVTVSGETAGASTRLVAAGDDGSGNSYAVELTVTDDGGNTASGTASAAETEEAQNSTPVINRFSVSEAGRPDPHAEVTVVWTVSDADSDLAALDIDVANATETVKGVSWSLSGDRASDTDSFRVKNGDGKTYDVTLTVTDESGATVSEVQSVTA